MNNKPVIVFTFPACMGGVASFNFNIINYSKQINNFTSKVVLLKAEEDDRPLFNERFIVDEVVTFHYSINENKYQVLKRLNKLLGCDKGAIVTDNSLTIDAAGLFKNPKTIFHLIHDYFYVNETANSGDLVDIAIAHSSFFSDAVFASNPTLFSARSLYIPYGVKVRSEFPEKDNPILKLVFLGRLVEEKGVKILLEINNALQRENISVEWTIIGKGPLKKFLIEQWKTNTNISFHEPESTHEVYKLLECQDIFIFPTVFEGTPVSILECLANGVIPIVNDLPGGIRDIVTDNIGFRCEVNNINEFSANIGSLYNNKKKLTEMQRACYELSHHSYNIEANADNYFNKFLEYEKYKRPIKMKKIKLSTLDKGYLPNLIVKFLRSIS